MKKPIKNKRANTAEDRAKSAKRKPLLVELLEKHAERNNWTQQELAQKLGISYSYYASVRNDTNPISELSYDVTSRIASLLNFPTVIVQLISGKLKAEDFYQSPASLGSSLDAALEFMQRDKEWTAFLPNGIFNASVEIKYALIRAYEKAEQRVLIPGQVTMESILKDYIDMIEKRNENELEK